MDEGFEERVFAAAGRAVIQRMMERKRRSAREPRVGMPEAGFLLLAFALASAPSELRAGCDARFRRGDYDADGRVILTDGVRLLGHLFLGGETPVCLDAADANDDGRVNLSDAVFLLDFLFQGRVMLPSPGRDCGFDALPDGLGCESYPACFQLPAAEVCDGVDNDCDGEIDEGFDTSSDPSNCGECGRSCERLEWARVAAYECAEGSCAIASCEPGWADADGIAENGCERPLGDGVPCDDGNPCTEDDILVGGICGGRPKDCSSLDDACNRGVCDRTTGECTARPLPATTPCDDGDPATSADRCDGRGECAGIPLPGGAR